MSGGIVQLVATGDQDKWLTGKPEVSFYRSSFRRYTHHASSVERQIIQGTPMAGGISTIRLEKKGDLVTYAYFTASDGNGAQVALPDWSKVIDKIDLMIGGQVIDSQDFTYMTKIEPVVGAQTFNQRLLDGGAVGPTNSVTPFLPLKFFFNKDWSSALPMIALQFHDVELRITWSANLATASTATGAIFYDKLQYTLWTNFVYLDQAERDFFSKSEHDMLMTQVQRVPIATAAMQELAIAHPVKFIAFEARPYKDLYGANGADSVANNAANFAIKTQVNGVDISEFRHTPHWMDVPQYYHTQFGYIPVTAAASVQNVASVAVIPFCLDTTKLQPTGTLNFSRIDTFRIVTASPTVTLKAFANNSQYLYAVNYNILRIKNGMGALLYAN